MKKENKHAVLSLSGGMDSTTLLLNLLVRRYKVTCLSFDYGQKHKVELTRAKELIQYLKANNIKVKHKVIQIKGLSGLIHSTLTSKGKEVPEGHYREENMKQTVVPNRNKIFSSIIQSAALSISNKTNSECVISLGIHKGDHDIYPDCRQVFRDADYEAFLLGNWDAKRVKYETPFLDSDKYEILKHGLECCESLGLNFNEVYKRTNTSYKPYPSGNSDYKSASSVERIEAFIKLGIPDPVIYEDENGIASWDKVTSHVENILLESSI